MVSNPLGHDLVESKAAGGPRHPTVCFTAPPLLQEDATFLVDAAAHLRMRHETFDCRVPLRVKLLVGDLWNLDFRDVLVRLVLPRSVPKIDSADGRLRECIRFRVDLRELLLGGQLTLDGDRAARTSGTVSASDVFCHDGV